MLDGIGIRIGTEPKSEVEVKNVVPTHGAPSHITQPAAASQVHTLR